MPEIRMVRKALRYIKHYVTNKYNINNNSPQGFYHGLNYYFYNYYLLPVCKVFTIVYNYKHLDSK